MKRFLLTGMLFLATGQFLAFAQDKGRSTYVDDIYYTADDAKKEAEAEAAQAAARRAANAQDERTYTSTGEDAVMADDYDSYNRSYGSDGDEYIDYNDDDYYYSSHIRRFNGNYGFGYYTPYYDPFWYSSWYSPWYYPYSGFSVSVGWGNPYYPYYGCSAWYGYPGFYSAWNYPYYTGWGGYYGSYYAGYYDGYYSGAGMYGNGRSVQYGPRTPFNAPRSGVRRESNTSGNLRSTQPVGNSGPREVMRSAPQQRMNNGMSDRAANDNMRSDRSYNSSDMRMRSSDQINDVRNNRAAQNEPQAAPQRSERRNRFFNNLSNAFSNGNNRQPQRSSPVMERSRQAESQPVYRQAQPSYQQPSYQRSAPASSSPSRSSGGSFGGGGRRR